MKKITILFLFLLLLFPIASKAEGEFNPGNIISDFELLNFKGMTLDDIQKFLEEKDSYLASLTTLDTYGKEKKASEIIYNAAVNNYDCDGVTLSDSPTEEERITKCKIIGTVNPKFLLVLLQKEQSLIEEQNPTQKQLDWATGYGCPDSMACNPYFKSFGKQVNSAALQFRWYMVNPKTPSTWFQEGETYTFKNKYGTISNEEIDVLIENKATAALYIYTPHVYNGNYNFWKIWNRYFPPQGYPEGTLLKVGDDYWLIQYGKKRKFSSISVLASRYNPNRAVIVNSSELSAYEEGAPIRFSNYSVIMSPDGKLYLLVDNKKRLFSSTEAFRKIGINVEEIMSASWQDINSYQDGKEINIASAYPTGALLQNKTTGGVFYVEEETKAPLIDKIFLQTKFKGKQIIPVEESELNLYTTISPYLFGNGEILKSDNSSAVYLIEDGKKRAFSSGEVFENLGYQWKSIISVPEKIINLYSEGEFVK
ncbi:hypothetical protein CVU82_00430 [Candidatus Falkowbacteria bacterium HGW-Falkowbacteria-1]|uniref:Uncharacterized protein n=1 Tax=Candidatus Falkowbacteria bacterium HGW-Falkowbacteria-1 TaxID=2013768 RepID=A0A2N2EA94_9BACT|nr:MAG: hypothetical protein CVU82_00430 [Candidatus Falkowbacteria bacterium HGW-Falkowbacteria-1]